MTGIHRVGVVGGGLMGAGIAQVAAQAGFATTCREVSNALCERAHANIARSMERGVEKGKMTAAEREGALSRLAFVTDLAALASCDIVIEAIVEDPAAKAALWRELDGLASPVTIFATNTSSLSVAAMAAATRRADRFIGMHFFNPVPAMRLVEIVRTVTTSDATHATVRDFAVRLGKEPIDARDTPGFVVNLLLVPFMLDAIRAFEGGVASVRDIDLGMTLGASHPMGPLALCDYVGLDTLQHVAESMYGEFRERRYAPPPLLTRMVVSGMLGKKNGRGFYVYGDAGPVPSVLTG
jgi:3-hydroxybutyryl-CoA dehydrogenase